MFVISKRQKVFLMVVSLEDLSLEAQLLQEGSKISSLSSPHYKKPMSIRKYVYGAFIRCKIQSFEEGW